MSSIGHDRPKRVGVGVAVVLGAVAGLYGSTFGPFRAMLVGVIVAAGGVAGLAFRGNKWARVVLAVGIAVVIGACAYILLGILLPHGAGSGSGGCGPGGICQP